MKTSYILLIIGFNLFSMPAFAESENPVETTKKWEYKVLGSSSKTAPKTARTQELELNQLGRKGWELVEVEHTVIYTQVTVRANPTGTMQKDIPEIKSFYYLKREISNK